MTMAQRTGIKFTSSGFSSAISVRTYCPGANIGIRAEVGSGRAGRKCLPNASHSRPSSPPRPADQVVIAAPVMILLPISGIIGGPVMARPPLSLQTCMFVSVRC